MVVLHYTGMRRAESAIARLRDPEARVSCHYLIAEDGQDIAHGRRGRIAPGMPAFLLAAACMA